MEKLLLDRIERRLAADRPAYLAQLRPGVTDTELDAFEARFSLALSADFRALYRWRNGQGDGCYESLLGNRMFLTLQDVAETKEEFDGMIGYDFDRPEWWRRGWVPFLSNGGGSYLCLDATAEDGGEPGQLVAFWKADEDRPVEYPSVAAWLTGLAEAMEAGEAEVW